MRGHRAGERALTVVELLIAALLLTAVVSGIALAVSGATKVQTQGKVTVSMQTAAQRAFEELRTNRDWMSSCGMTHAAHGCPIGSAIDPSVLEEEAMGPSCTGSGAFRFQVVRAVARPVDSEVDGTGPDDKDGRIPDYHTIEVVVGIPSQCAARFPGVKPITYSSAVDSRGRIPTGSLVVEVCVAANQADDRMSIAGCAPSAPTDMKMTHCPPHSSTAMSPITGCSGAWNRIQSSAPSPSSPSPYVRLVRANASFTLRNGSTAIPSSQAQRLSTGEYLFRNLPAGTYRLDGLTPSGVPYPVEQWRLKMIPSWSSTGLDASAIVQPDTRSRALVAFRAAARGRLPFYFDRQVRRFNVTSASTGWTTVHNNRPTTSWGGDPVAFFFGAARATVIENAIDELCGGTCPITSLTSNPERPSPNCYRFGFLFSSAGTPYDFTVRTCTRYEFRVRFHYKVANEINPVNRPGPALSSSYATTPAPTYRHTVPMSESATTSTSACPLWTSLAPVGGHVPVLNSTCARSGRQGGSANVDIAGLRPGLYTGVRASAAANDYTPWNAPVPFLNDGNGPWTAPRNDAIYPIPSALTVAGNGALWIRPDGQVVGGDGRLYPQQAQYRHNGRIHVRGRGECVWLENGAGPERVASCNENQPYIRSLGGTYGSKYVLTAVEYCFIVRYSDRRYGNVIMNQITIPADGTEAGRTCGTAPQRKPCSGVPRVVGEHVAGNCRTAPRPPSTGGGGSVSSSPISTDRVPHDNGSGDSGVQPAVVA